ncbi:MAG: protein kinase [Chthoniobacterales bacterium]
MSSSSAASGVCTTCRSRIVTTASGDLGCLSCLLRTGSEEESVETMNSAPPASFGAYVIARHEDGSPHELGRGAMGITFLAEDASLQRPVALKIIKGDFAQPGSDARERFMREARAAAALRHPNVAIVYQFGLDDETGQYFCAMELIEGETLEERVRRTGPLDLTTVLTVARQVTAALAAAESCGVVHRDLKPGNIMITAGKDAGKTTVKVIDFGVAKALQEAPDARTLTHGGFVGTPAFSSPEQMQGAAVDVRSDIYSLGATLACLLTGRMPPPDRTMGLAAAIQQLKSARVPFTVIKLLSSMLAEEPAARPGVETLAKELECISRQPSSGRRFVPYLAIAAYVIVSWLLTQAASILFPTFEAPAWVIKVFVTALILGFPIALILAWAFELTPEGIKRAEDVPPHQSITPRTGRKLLGITVVLAVIAAGLLAFQFLHPKSVTSGDPAKTAAPTPTSASVAIPEQSIAVLPFENLSRDPDNAFFASGIQDEILTRLAKIGALKVISRTSTQQYQSKPGNLSEIGKRLGVAHILEGSVQKAGNAVHINVQLIKAASDAQVWAEIYDRKLDDIFGVEGEVATAIAEALSAKVTGREKQTITAKLTNNPEAYDAYLRGLTLFSKTDDFRITSAKPFFEQAVHLDPGFATAWALLSRLRALEFFFNGADAQRAAARVALDAGLRLKPDLLEVQLAQVYFQYHVEKNYDVAAARFEQLLGKWPNNAEILEALGYIVRRQGHWDKARAYWDQAVALDPLSERALQGAFDVRTMTRDFDGALRFINEVLNIAPDRADFIASKALLYQQVGELDQAEAVLRGLPPGPKDLASIAAITNQARFRRSYAGAISQLEGLLQLHQATGSRGFTFSNLHENLGDMRRLSGDERGARNNYLQARDELLVMLKAQADIPAGALDGARAGIYDALATVYSGLGDRDAAMQYADRAVNLLPVAKDAVGGYGPEATRALVEARFGDRDRAIPAFERLLKLPGFLTPGFLRLMSVDPDFDLLRGDPRFEKLCQEKKP